MESRLHVLNEVYFGKTPEILKIEKAIGALRAQYLDDFRDIGINADPLKFKIEDAICEAFGFEVVDFQIICSKITNAATMPIGWELDTLPSENLIIHNKHGFRYKKEAGYGLFMFAYTGLLVNSKFTDGEITAILLHEIGHNFTGGIYPTIGIFQKLFLLPDIIKAIVVDHTPLDVLLTTNFATKGIASIHKALATKYKFLYYILEGMNMILNTFRDMSMFLSHLILAIFPFAIIAMLPSMVIGLLLSPGRILLGTGDESFADAFPAMYGYGEEIASGLEKFDHTHGGNVDFGNLCKSCSIVGLLFDLAILPYKLVCGLFEEHSESCVRAVKTLNYLEYELEKGHHSPKAKARLKKDIAKTKQVLERYNNFASGLDHRAVRNMWSQVVLQTKFYALYSWVLNYSEPQLIDKQAKSIMSQVKLK